MKAVKAKKKSGRAIVIILLLLLVIAALIAGTYSHFGGFGTGKSADTVEFAKYAGAVSDISIPTHARIIALGEATHGNAEFQQLKLEVFKLMVEKYGVRAFALEGDYGGCATVNRYIHGGNGTAQEAAAAIGFTIYRTEQIAQLIAWMREYNATAGDGDDLCFYGFDMQNIDWNYYYLTKAAEAQGIDASELTQLWDDETGTPSDACTVEQWATAIKNIKQQLEQHEGTSAAVHHADILLQNYELGNAMNSIEQGIALRDKYMADNVCWVLTQEALRGHNRIFISAHNGHIQRHNTYSSAGNAMGHLLADQFGDNYFAIGTDFYRSCCNLPKGRDRVKRGTHTFYSHDPLAKAAKKCGYETCWLDFANIPDNSPLKQQAAAHIWMGSIGEGYTPLMLFLPTTYRVHVIPETIYDGIIFVANAHPTQPDAATHKSFTE